MAGVVGVKLVRRGADVTHNPRDSVSVDLVQVLFLAQFFQLGCIFHPPLPPVGVRQALQSVIDGRTVRERVQSSMPQSHCLE